MEFKEIKFEHAPEYNSIQFVSKWITVDICSSDMGGDVEICIDRDGESASFYLNQENIKQLIVHLQKQIK